MSARSSLLLLDVDGVLNAVRRTPPIQEAGWKDWRQVRVAGFPILAAEPVLDFVRQVHRSGSAEIRWLTTWERGDLVLTDLAPALELPQFPIAGRAVDHPAKKFSDTSHWWKFEVVKALAATEDPRIVWVDDDLAPYARDAYEWVADRPDRVLGVSPDTQIGLVQHDLDRINVFLTEGAA